MKRIASIMLASILSLSTYSIANAVEIKISGYHDVGFGIVSGTDFIDESGKDNFSAGQRFRTQIDIIASEALKGVLYFEIGQTDWGQSADRNVGGHSGGALSADGVNIKTRRAYIDWMVPNTDLNFRIGIQELTLPGAVAGSPVFDDDVAAFLASYKFNDQFALTAIWARPFDTQENDGWDKNVADETDVFALVAPITLDGFSITPWAAYANAGLGGDTWSDLRNYTVDNRGAGADYNDRINTKTSKAWWAGLALEVDVLDPVVLKFDAMYGSIKANNVLWNDENYVDAATTKLDRDFKASGWFVDAMIEYKANWGTPGLFGWYSSGMDEDDVKDGHYNVMPTIAGSFYPTSFGSDGGGNHFSKDTYLFLSGIGMWGVGAQIKDMSFIEDLTHTVRFTFMGGTNDKEAIRDLGANSLFAFNDNQNNGDAPYYNNLATNETAFEINFDNTYKIYENLTMFTDIGFIRLNLDNDLRVNATGKNNDRDPSDFLGKNAWKAMTGFRYSF